MTPKAEKGARGPALLAALILAGCAASPVHIPDNRIVPLLCKQGEVHVSGTVFNTGGTLQAAAAVTDRVALAVNGVYTDLENCRSCRIDVRRHLDAAVGHFFQDTTGRIMEGYLGLGVGRNRSQQSNDWDPSSEELVLAQGDYAQAFFQVNRGRTGKWIDHAVFARLTGVYFYDYEARNGLEEPVHGKGWNWGIFLEPGFAFRAGYRHLKGEVRIGTALPLMPNYSFNQELIELTIGLHFNSRGGRSR